MSENPSGAHATRPLEQGASPTREERAYLLVLQGESSSHFPLPASGMVLIGRGEEADLLLKDDSISRRHARLVLTGGEARLVDLDSHNGTWVNGRRLEGAHPLVSGDVVTLGEVVLVLRTRARALPARRALEPEPLRERLTAEVARALRYGRPLTVLAVAAPGGVGEALEAACASGASPAGAYGWQDARHLLVLLPEVSGAPGEEELEEYVEALAAAAPGCCLGYAVCPSDGCDVDTLVAAARMAAAGASPGQLASATDGATWVELGERRLLVADPAMVQLYALIRRLAASELPVLVSGETGTGKENAAFAVHHGSRRGKGPFITLNCAAIPENLVESELFGHERGAFTGATTTKVGLLESANGGTVFLDEVGELPLAAQAKLLRALEVRRITRVGDVRERPIDIRVVAATHRDLEAEVAAGRFRQDLYYRLGAATVLLPPLRERPREILLLARHFLSQACRALGRRELVLAPDTLQRLAGWSWPGNVRELRNLMDYAAAAVAEDVLEPHHLPARMRSTGEALGAAEAPPTVETLPTSQPPATGSAPLRRSLPEELRELERSRMQEALDTTGGVQARAAALVGMPVRTFGFKMKQYGLAARAGRGEPASS